MFLMGLSAANAQGLLNNEMHISFDSTSTSDYISTDTVANKWMVGTPDPIKELTFRHWLDMDSGSWQK